MEGSSGRDISGLDVPGPAASGPDDSKALRDSSSSRESTSEAPSEDSDMSVGQSAAPKRQTRTPKGSVGKALQEKRRRQNMLGAVELCDNAMLMPVLQMIHQMFQSCMIWQTKPCLATSRQTGLTAPTTTFSVLAPPPHLHHLLQFRQVSTALPQHLRNTQGMRFLPPVVRTCTQSWCSLEWWVVQSGLKLRAGRLESF